MRDHYYSLGNEVLGKMAINFNEHSVFNLKQIDNDKVQKDMQGFLIEGEEILSVFHTVRDQLVFTNKRIIAIDIQGVTGMKKTFAVMPYSRIQYFTINTPGFAELFGDIELFLQFTDGFTATFEFNTRVDIGAIERSISTFVLR